MKTLVIAEHDQARLAPAVLNTLGAASILGSDITVLVAGFQCRSVAEQAASLQGVTQVLLVDDERYAHSLAEVMAPLVIAQAEDYSHVLAAASTFGKNLLPRIAALLDVAQLSDIIGIDDAETFRRPIYAGNAIATVRSSDSVKIVTVRVTAFDPVTDGGAADIVDISPVDSPSVTRFVREELSQSDRPDLTTARVVVSGGRGLQNSENFQMLEQLADLMDGAVGASRAAVDAGFAANDYQVGQTGKIVAPDLYIAVGISGAIQHLAGMKESKVIVAINKDPDAPIFQIADYGLVADLFDAVPEMISSLQ